MMYSPLLIVAAAILQHFTPCAAVINGTQTDLYRQRAQSLLEQMTWKEKIGQLGGYRRLLEADATFNRTRFDELYPTQNGNLGYGSAFNWASDVVPIANRIKQRQIDESRLHIPFVTVTDSNNGIYISGGTIFPSNLGMAASFNLPLFEQAIAVIREEQRAIGVNWVLSPPLDVTSEPRYGRIGEDFGEDAYLVGEFGKTYVLTMEEKGEGGFVKVATTMKHYVYGETSGGVNLASQYGGINHIYNDQLRPYIKVIEEAKPLSIMASYSSVDRLPMHKNRYMFQDILRQKLGFEGLIMTDANGIWQMHNQMYAASSLQDAAVQAVHAGIEMELCPPSEPTVCGMPTLLNAINGSAVLQRDIDQAVLAFLEIKFRTGLFDQSLPDPQKLNSTLRLPQSLEIAREMSREAIAMLQNDGLLPKTPGRVALIGPFGNILNSGSYAAVNSSDARYGDSLHRSMKNAFGSGKVSFTQGCDFIDTDDDSGIQDAVAAAKDAGFAVVALGSLSVSPSDPLFLKRTDGEFFAHADLGFPGLQQQLLDAVLDVGVPTVLVVSGGQPFVLNPSAMRANAIFHTFLSGEFTGDAVVELITGKVNPSGKLTVSMPQYSGAIPIAYDLLPSDQGYDQAGLTANNISAAWQFPNLTRSVPMPFGYGLSYTTFKFSNPTVSSNNQTSCITVNVSLNNTGDVFGKEVVQVYYRPIYTPDIEFPVKSLVRFEKVGLEPGQSQDVHFVIARRELGYWVNTELTSPPGPYTFWIGSSSRVEDLHAVNVTLPMWTA
ncbi:uncharacterized protein LTR77_008229 [Saxophila tyrrhenica]|uniref:beta-glucosidase n=1 Tax=Saxophila tyrrhenica TaxID=1690608 RepID=A0AAV9P270_9PEZI|nr:hypothetical protein LTR77_008229 [Saxophila tyrrhenica]